MTEEYAALIGLDWADQKHLIRMRDMSTNKIEEREIEQKAEVLAEWVDRLRKRFPGAKVAIAVEQSRGPLIYALMRYEFLVIYPVNPKTIVRYREALRVSGAKDDPQDAELLLSFLSAHRDRLRPWVPEDEITRHLALLVEFRKKLDWEICRMTNRLRDLLKGYYPQALLMVTNLASKLGCDFLTKWPSVFQLIKARPAHLRKFYYSHSSRKAELIEQRIKIAQNAQPLTEDAAIIAASVLMVGTLVGQLRELLAGIEKLDKEIAKVFRMHPDRQIYESFPGAGAVLEPRLAAGMGTNRDRYDCATEMQQFVGTAPVTVSSGKSHRVHRRLARPRFLMQTHVEFAALSIPHSPWAAAYYQQQRQKGSSHRAAVRALAFKWDRILFRCWKDRIPYDEEKYIKALNRRNSPLIKYLNPCKSPWTHSGSTELMFKIQQILRAEQE